MAHSPRSLLSLLLITATLVTVVLGVFGHRLRQNQQQLADQDARLAEQSGRARLDTSADALAARMREKLAETGERLSAWLSNTSTPPPDIDNAAIVATTVSTVIVSPAGALPFVPAVPPARDADPRIVAAESLEFSPNESHQALDTYRTLATDPDATVRASAWLRLSRMLRQQGDYVGATTAGGKLAALDTVTVDGYPAGLIGLDSLRLAATASGDAARARAVAGEMTAAIDRGRWLLTRQVADFFRDQVGQGPRPDAWRLAEALTAAFDAQHAPDRGLKSVSIDGSRVLTMWRASGGSTIALAALTDRFLPPPPAEISYELTDSEGGVIGGAAATAAQTAARLVGDPQAPWTLRVWLTSPPQQARDLSQLPIAPMMVAMALCLWAAVYFIARAIRREAAVSQLQTDFVAAVSHEFRSPLTTMRQLGEMLEMGQVPSEERRQQYYELVVTETRRLQRLVETLLNFGRMEAGAERYRSAPIEVYALIHHVVSEFQSRGGRDASRLAITTTDRTAAVMGDADALALAVRNLIDNALKYSPPTSTVRISSHQERNHLTIQVADEGPGIVPGEREAIFQKFVRGRAASDANIKGTGVGLAMVRHIVAAHGGDIRLDSDVGRGSTFSIILPAADTRTEGAPAVFAARES